MDDLFSGVWEKGLVGALSGAILAILVGPFVWLNHRREKRKAEEESVRERAARETSSKAQRENDEKWAREFASKPVPDIGRKRD